MAEKVVKEGSPLDQKEMDPPVDLELTQGFRSSRRCIPSDFKTRLARCSTSGPEHHFLLHR